MKQKGTVVCTQEFTAVAIPRLGIVLAQAQDLWLAAGPENRVLDDGGRSDPRLLVGADKSRTVLYEVIPEGTDPEVEFQQMLTTMSAAGWDVRGEGPVTRDGHRTIMVSERIGDASSQLQISRHA